MLQQPKSFDHAWRLFRGLVLLIGLLVGLSSTSAYAQGAGTPTALPATAVITPQNAAQVKQLARFGKGTVDNITWSPTGDTLAVTGSLGLWLYDAHNLSTPPRLLDIPFPTNPDRVLSWSLEDDCWPSLMQTTRYD